MTTFLLPFEKMHGLGNDFIMLERRHLPNNVNEPLLAKLLCDRHFNIGADGLIIIDISPNKDTDFIWKYYNSDGSEAEMCGNGMRCFAKYVYEHGFTDDVSFSVLTKAGIITPTIETDGNVTVMMGNPKIPDKIHRKLNVDSKEFYYTYIEIGNPHCVIFNENYVSDDDFFYLGPRIEKHALFENRINVEFAKVINYSEIKCRVWERGAGPTLSCGTGACATLVAANLNNISDSKAKVILPGGALNIWWDKNNNSVYLNGPAMFTFIGEYMLDPKLVCN